MQYFLLFKKDTITSQQDSKFLSSEWTQLSELQTNKSEIYISKWRHIQRVRLARWLAHPTKSSIVGLGSLTHPLCLELEISLDAWCAHATWLCRIKGFRNQKTRFATTCIFCPDLCSSSTPYIICMLPPQILQVRSSAQSLIKEINLGRKVGQKRLSIHRENAQWEGFPLQRKLY